MRDIWDELAAAADVYVGDPARGRQELDGLFGRLRADPRGGTCVEVGCGSGRMTPFLADRFDHVLAVDVSPAMLEHARGAVEGRSNVELRPVSGERLDGIASGLADTLVCYLVLQHLPHRALVVGYLAEFARVLAPRGEAFVQLPVLEPGAWPRLRRGLAGAATPVVAALSRDVAHAAPFRGTRLTERELDAGLAGAGLAVVERAGGPDAPYRHSHDVFLRLRRA